MPAPKKKPAAKESNAIVQENAETPDEPVLDADANVLVQTENAESHNEPVMDADTIMNQITDSEGNIKLNPYSAAKAAALNAALAKPNLKELDIKLEKARASLPDKVSPAECFKVMKRVVNAKEVSALWGRFVTLVSRTGGAE